MVGYNGIRHSIPPCSLAGNYCGLHSGLRFCFHPGNFPEPAGAGGMDHNSDHIAGSGFFPGFAGFSNSDSDNSDSGNSGS